MEHDWTANDDREKQLCYTYLLFGSSEDHGKTHQVFVYFEFISTAIITVA